MLRREPPRQIEEPKVIGAYRPRASSKPNAMVFVRTIFRAERQPRQTHCALFNRTPLSNAPRFSTTGDRPQLNS